MSFGDLALKIGMLLVFFGVMIFVGFYCRKTPPMSTASSSAAAASAPG